MWLPSCLLVLVSKSARRELALLPTTGASQARLREGHRALQPAVSQGRETPAPGRAGDVPGALQLPGVGVLLQGGRARPQDQVGQLALVLGEGGLLQRGGS